jgi:glycosyltransferase involved in cell wall biosynthesis
VFRFEEGTTPEQLAQLRSSWQLGERLELHGALYHVDRLPHPGIDAYERLDLGLTWRPEYRKGQDLVVAAFRRFRERHPEALLVTAWHNAWPQLISDLDLAGHVSGTPRFNSEGLLVTEWLDANGLPPEAVLDIGRTPNALMGAVVREADVALFPNRCEGGTNLVAMECIAAGVPTIVSANTGHLDLVATGGCIALTRQAPVRPPTRFYKATEGWGESSIDEIVDALEKVYSGRQAASDAAIRGAAVMKDWTWPRQIDRLMQVLAPLAG